MKNLEVKKDGRIARITFSRPESLNTYTLDLSIDLRIALEDVTNDKNIRVVVITGEGEAFCAGGDINMMKDAISSSPENLFKTITNNIHESINLIIKSDQIFIGSINGMSAGSGFSIVLACDLVLASSKACFKLAYTGIGLAPDSGATFILPKLIGPKRTMELALSNKIISPEDAFNLGIINRITLPEKLNEETENLAKHIAEGPYQAFRQSKHLLNEPFYRGFDDQMYMEKEAVIETCNTKDFREGVLAFVEKRRSEWE